MATKNYLTTLISLFILASCGGGGGGGGGSAPPDSGPQAQAGSSNFVDAPVGGMEYSLNGGARQLTRADGGFDFLEGDQVTFFIGGIELGTITADPSQPFATPASLAGASNGNGSNNIARLLITLDTDGNPDNGIQITDVVRARAKSLQVTASDLQSGNLEDSPAASFAAENGGRALVSAQEAQEHLEATLADISDGRFDSDGGADTDADGVNDAVDACPNSNANANVDADGCEPEARDEDDDNDTVANVDDNCPAVSNLDQQDTDADGRGDACDLDDDNDGAKDTDEVSAGTNPQNPDSDGDGVNDPDDAFPNDASRSVQPDTDGDGVSNRNDNCPTDANDTQADFDRDGRGDACDNDDDGDGRNDDVDAFPLDPSEQDDTDGDSVGDVADNCPAAANPSQADFDQDGAGDACDTDDDNDGRADAQDAFPLDPNEQDDTDGDGQGDVADTDDDNDGLSDQEESNLGTNPRNADTDGDGIDDGVEVSGGTDPNNSDSDQDGANDGADAFPLDSTEQADDDGDGVGNNADAFDDDPTETTDTDGDNIGDNADSDDDNDGVNDDEDAFPLDKNEQTDLNNNGIGDNADLALINARLPTGVAEAALKVTKGLPAPSADIWPFGNGIPKTSGTGRYQGGAYFWSDFIYDANGAQGIPPAYNTGTPTGGGLYYPGNGPDGTSDDGKYEGNGADIFAVAVAADDQFSYWRVDWQTLADDSAPVIAFGLDYEEGGSQGFTTLPPQAWPGVPRLFTVGIDATIIISKAGAFLHLADGSAPQRVADVNIDLNSRSFVAQIARASLPALGGKWTLRAVSGVHDGDGGFLDDMLAFRGSPTQPPVFNAAFRDYSDEAQQGTGNAPAIDQKFVNNFWMNANQASALAQNSVDAFSVELDWARLGVNEPEPRRVGYSNRWYVSSAEYDRGGQYTGLDASQQRTTHFDEVQPYGLWVPSSYDFDAPSAMPMTLMLHSFTQNHNQYIATIPNFQKQSCETLRQSFCLTVLGRGQAGWYEQRSELDLWESWHHVAESFVLDPERAYSSGYSMGAMGTLRMLTEYPEVFAGGVVIAGSTERNASGNTVSSCFAHEQLENLRWNGYYQAHGALDQLVPVTGTLADVERLRQLNYEYMFDLYPAEDHIAWTLKDIVYPAFFHATEWLRDTAPQQRKATAGEIIYSFSDADLDPELGFGPTSVWWLSGMQVADASMGVTVSGTPAPVVVQCNADALAGTARIKATSGALQEFVNEPVFEGISYDPNNAQQLSDQFSSSGSTVLQIPFADGHPGGETPHLRQYQFNEGSALTAANEFLSLHLENVGALAVDLTKAGFSGRLDTVINVNTDADIALTLSGADPFVDVSVDQLVVGQTDANGEITINLTASDTQQRIELAEIDSDGDGVSDGFDAFPDDASEQVDTDGDGQGDNADNDDDGDGRNDDVDAFPLDATEQDDSDGDGQGDNSDRDDDNDGVEDRADVCPNTEQGDSADSQGCSAGQLQNASCETGIETLGSRSYHVLIPSPIDGKQVSFQVLEPTDIDCGNVDNGAHPLILQGHGFGGARVEGDASATSQERGFAGYRDEGYAVISIDQRGFGASDGTIRTMDPEIEGANLNAILDWAEQNLDYLAWRDESNGNFVERPSNAQSIAGGVNLLVGAIGSSYGGGYQLLILATDEKNRLDALVPDITWHDLRHSLNPGDTIKTGWDLALVGVGEGSSAALGLANQLTPDQRGLDPFVRETLLRAAATNEFPRDALKWFNYHSLGFWCANQNLPTMPYQATDWGEADRNRVLFGDFQDEAVPVAGTLSRRLPAVDVLLTQGFRDTLFNFNEAWYNYQCLSALGGDVFLYTHQTGHVLPVGPTDDLQPGTLAGDFPADFPIVVPGFQDGDATGLQACGDKDVDAAGGALPFVRPTDNPSQFILDWFGDKLKGQDRFNESGDVCLSLADGDAVEVAPENMLAPGADTANYSRFDVQPLVVANGPAAVATVTLGPAVAGLAQVTGDQDMILAGIPTATLTVKSLSGINESNDDNGCEPPSVANFRTGCDSIIVVGIGVQRVGTRFWDLADDQLRPVRGLGTHQFELSGIADRLKPGDRLALLAYGFHPQYPASWSRDASLPGVVIEGSVNLPLYLELESGDLDAASAGSALQSQSATSLQTYAVDEICGNFGENAEPLCNALRNFSPPEQTPKCDVNEPDCGPDETRRAEGVLGVLDILSVTFNEIVTGLSRGDFGQVRNGISSGASLIAARFEQILLADENSLASALGNFKNNVLQDPQTAIGFLLDDLSAVFGLNDDAVSVIRQKVAAERRVEPVILTGADILAWSQLPAQGVGNPYPSGTTSDLNQIGDGIRSPYNGRYIYPQDHVPGESAPRNFGGVPVQDIVAYRFENGQAIEIPVQVDERFIHFLANANSEFSTYSGTDEELTYAWTHERWDAQGNQPQAQYGPAIPDPIAGLDHDDEVVFMASDAGECVSGEVTISGVSDIQMVSLIDPLARDTGAVQCVYLGLSDGGSSFSADDGYVQYRRTENADDWLDRFSFCAEDPQKLGSSNRSYGANLEGKVFLDNQNGGLLDCFANANSAESEDYEFVMVANSGRDSEDRFPRDSMVVSTESYQLEASGRWMLRDIKVRKNDGSLGVDLIDRWKGRAFQQSPDSSISLVGFEDEQVNWEANASLLGEKLGPVRAIREIWGADSGTNVTKTETFYRDVVTHRYRVRVHVIPPDGLYTSWDYNRSAMVSDDPELNGRYYTALRPQGVLVDGINDDVGQVDEIFDQQAFFDAADPLFNFPSGILNWEQVSGKEDNGSLVYIFELKGPTSGANSAIIPYYRDDACLDDGTGDDPVRRPWPGEDQTDPRVVETYNVWAGRELGDSFEDCLERQGAHASHGIHMLVLPESDNAFLPVRTTEVDGQQWQFMVPTDRPELVAEPYANVVIAPLVKLVVPVKVPGRDPTDKDGDGTPDGPDAFPYDPNEQSDIDGDGVGDNADTDRDNDGVENAQDACPDTVGDSNHNAEGCGARDRDSDNDGVNDAEDNCPNTPAGPENSDGCNETQFDLASCELGQALQGGRSIHAVIPSNSGREISFQILEPIGGIRCEAGAHPLILQGHGFGGSRTTEENSFGALRNRGYAVISIDLRGFGDSSGSIRVMDPKFEGEDLIAILDWAEQNLDWLAWRDESTGQVIDAPADRFSVAGGPNLLVGAIGGSYGGGYQLLLLAVDEKNRLDALVPDITWHDLRYSLNPGDTVKTGWDLALVAGGESASQAEGLQNGEGPGAGSSDNRGLDPFIKETLARGAATNEFPRDSLDWFNYHSLGFWCANQNLPTMPYPHPRWSDDPNRIIVGELSDEAVPVAGEVDRQLPAVNVLLTQGFRDTLFNFNDAWWNYQCLSALGGDVRLLTHQNGHILPVAAPNDSQPSNFGVPFQVPGFQDAGGAQSCGTTSLSNQSSTVITWFDEKLRGLGQSSLSEDLCISLANNDSVNIPADEFLAARDAGFGPAVEGFSEFDLGSAFPVANGSAAVATALLQPTVVELTQVVNGDVILAGIPQLDVSLTTVAGVNPPICDPAEDQVPTTRAGCDAIIFAGVVHQQAGTQFWDLVDDQVYPLRGLRRHQVDLNGIAERIKPGDKLGVMFTGFHPQFPVSWSRDETVPVVMVSGKVRMPLYADTSEGVDAARINEHLLQAQEPILHTPGRSADACFASDPNAAPLCELIESANSDLEAQCQESSNQSEQVCSVFGGNVFSLVQACYFNGAEFDSNSRTLCKIADTFVSGVASYCRTSLGFVAPSIDRETFAGAACAVFSSDEISERQLEVYDQSWAKQAHDLQRELSAHQPLKHTFYPSTHNSFNATTANTPPTLSGSDANQRYELVEQLRMDIRGLEIDVHWTSSLVSSDGENFTQTQFQPTVCHGNQEHFGCTSEKSLFAEMSELAAWLEAHPDQVVIIDLEDNMSESIDQNFSERYAQAVEDVTLALGDKLFKPQTAYVDGVGVTRVAPSCDQGQPLDVSINDVRRSDAQVMIYSSCNFVDADGESIFFGRSNTHLQLGSGSQVGIAALDNCLFTPADSVGKWVRYFEDGTLVGALTGKQALANVSEVREMARCNINMPSLDHVLPFDGRIQAMVWSWAEDQPTTGNCSISNAEGRFTSAVCASSQSLPAACQDMSAELTEGDAYNSRRWAIGVHASACSLLNQDASQDYQFSVPANGLDNELLKAAKSAAGASEVQLNYQKVDGTWTAPFSESVAQ